MARLLLRAWGQRGGADATDGIGTPTPTPDIFSKSVFIT